jgi:DMSO/TMAO reductase YedYZ molybdopterin-dependent catalytic subunit
LSRSAYRPRDIGMATPGIFTSALGGLVAAAAAGAGMGFLRSTLQVRSVPERLIEWLLIYIPVDAFAAGVQRFGFDAKRYALWGGILATLAVLVLLGAIALRRGWSVRAIAGLGLALYLFTMVVVMPLTDAGPFAVALIDGTKAAVMGYFAVAVTYVAVLALVREVLLEAGRPFGLPAPGVPRGREGNTFLGSLVSRRSATLLVGAAVASYAATFLATLLGPRQRFTTVRVLDPQEPVPSGGIGAPNPHPNLLGTPELESPRAPRADGPSGSEPPPPRPLLRDRDGALLPSGRRPGDLAELHTPNEHFYIVTKNPVADPMLRVENWRLILDGEVERPVQLDHRSLRNLPTVEVTKTLECISNFVTLCDMVPFGCDLMGNARWKGARMSDVLALAGGVKPGVLSIATISADEYTTALSLEAALDPQTLLVYEMNGEMLPREHGYPVRVLVPGRYGMKNAKWVVNLRALRREFVDWYGQRMWSKDGIVKTMTRIDVPAPKSVLSPGQHRIAGIAYGGDRGIARVEFSADGGRNWQAAQFIEPSVGRDAWVRWQGNFNLSSGGDVTLVARATDGSGEVQQEAFSLPQPDGGAGWHTCEISVRLA